MAGDFTALRELCAVLRTERVQYLRLGELELRFEDPQVAPPAVLALPSLPAPSDEEEDSETAERRSLETLLHSSGVDPDALLRAMRGARAA